MQTSKIIQIMSNQHANTACSTSSSSDSGKSAGATKPVPDIKTYQNISKHIKTYQNISKHIKTYQNISKHIKTYQNISKRSICSPQQAQRVPAVPALNNTILHVGWMGSEIKQTGSVRLIAFVLACSFLGRQKIVGEFASFSKHWARVVRLA